MGNWTDLLVERRRSEAILNENSEEAREMISGNLMIPRRDPVADRTGATALRAAAKDVALIENAGVRIEERVRRLPNASNRSQLKRGTSFS